jgi:hypothetical protein
MKKLTLFVVLAIVVWSLSGIAYAWDVYIYNKTKYKINYIVYQQETIGESNLAWGSLASGENTKVTTGFWGMKCATVGKAFPIINNFEQLGATTSDNNPKCYNLRLEISHVEQTNDIKVQWFPQL